MSKILLVAGVLVVVLGVVAVILALLVTIALPTLTCEMCGAEAAKDGVTVLNGEELDRHWICPACGQTNKL